jgi:hypothetical protein
VLFIFAFIGIVFFGCLKNRKTKKIPTTKSKIFLPTAIISISLIAISVLYLIIVNFVDLGLVVNGKISLAPESGFGFPDQNSKNNEIIAQVLSIVMLFVYLSISFIPSLFAKRRTKSISVELK